ncbi:uncharacterized protein PAC_13166 [Phialocephala subalpina]|uniref:ATP-dependent RNA helicase DHX8 n=1 Tax=Phialocephala subalpina TaxID=576137 RepID=A0A1L7XE01_9HELO|nr:uncharacterized protein PAC_13166 [Phialocephala subalpina]
MTKTPSTTTPYRQIRAKYDDETITVYQAYSESIATAAVSSQKLSSSPDFSYNRMTWIKPSFCWMMYRSGYAQKDSRQTHILALTMTHAHFRELLMQAAVTNGTALSAEDRKKDVRVQWDPERGPGLEERAYRSLQVGIGRGMSKKWVEEWVLGIEDVTEMARKLKEAVDGAKERREKLGVEELVKMGCLPEERVYEVDGELRGALKMDETGH